MVDCPEDSRPQMLSDDPYYHIVQRGLTTLSENTDGTVNALSDPQQFFVALVHSWPEPTLPVRLIETKQQLGYGGVGQLMTYREFFSSYHSVDATTVEVVDCELVYATADSFVEAAAEQLGLTCTPVPPPP